MPEVNQSSNLSYNKSLSPSYGQMLTASSANPDDMRPLPVVHLQGRGSVANYLAGVEADNFSYQKQQKKADSEDGGSEKKAQTPDAPNLYEGDTCFMPPTDDLLILRFNILVEGQTRKPHICSNGPFATRLADVATAYAKKDGYLELGNRYLANMLNGRPLWRNLTRQFGMTVEVTDLATGDVITNAKSLSLTRCELPESAEVAAFAEKLAKALAGDTAPMRIGVKITATMMPGCEVFPSQGFAENNDSGKLLAKDRFGNALMHPQKIGAALRCIDDWYPDADRVITAEPYGFDQSTLVCYRLKNGDDRKVGNNFYQLLFRADTDLLAPLQQKGPVPADVHYFMAVLARGGVFANVKSGK